MKINDKMIAYAMFYLLPLGLVGCFLLVSDKTIKTDNINNIYNDTLELSKLINSECSNCDIIEKILIGSVVINRLNHPDYPKTMLDVIYDNNQFKGICNSQYKSDTITYNIAKTLILQGPLDPTILYFYLRKSIDLSWRKNLLIVYKMKYHDFGRARN
jgi:N-acetylmuramoyl-L-alanine amidase